MAKPLQLAVYFSDFEEKNLIPYEQMLINGEITAEQYEDFRKRTKKESGGSKSAKEILQLKANQNKMDQNMELPLKDGSNTTNTLPSAETTVEDTWQLTPKEEAFAFAGTFGTSSSREWDEEAKNSMAVCEAGICKIRFKLKANGTAMKPSTATITATQSRGFWDSFMCTSEKPDPPDQNLSIRIVDN